MDVPSQVTAAIPLNPTDKYLVAAFGLGILGLLVWLVRAVVTRMSDGQDRLVAGQDKLVTALDRVGDKLDRVCDENVEAHEKTRDALKEGLQRMRQA